MTLTIDIGPNIQSALVVLAIMVAVYVIVFREK